MRLSYRYGLAFLLIFITELLIGIYVRDSFIRPFVGDLLVVVLIYCFLMTFLKKNPITVAIGVFVFACIVELNQYFKLNNVLAFEENGFSDVILGVALLILLT